MDYMLHTMEGMQAMHAIDRTDDPFNAYQILAHNMWTLMEKKKKKKNTQNIPNVLGSA